MNCKKCNAELEEGVQICPECGMNQAEAAENAVPAEVKVEKKESKMVPLKMVIAVAVVVALIAVFAVVIFGGLIGKQNVDPTEGTVPSQEVTPGATIPGTGLNDVSCKGSYTVSDEEVIAAAKLANAHTFIRHLEHGYDTMISGDGASLSQGQRQLLAIARCALMDPPVMILDEATSALDNTTEMLVQSALDKLCKGRTTIVVAHRLSTIKNADEIAVIANGHILEQGTHDTLISKKGMYYDLYQLQFRHSEG